MTTTQTHPVIVYTLDREIIGERMQHTLLLTDPKFYERLVDHDWAGTEFASGVDESENGSLPDAAGLWVAEFRIAGDADLYPGFQLVQGLPWRSLTDDEAKRFAQGCSIAEVLK